MLISSLAEVKKQRRRPTNTRPLWTRTRSHHSSNSKNRPCSARSRRLPHCSWQKHAVRPAFLNGDELSTFNVVLANPPYSISAWNREAWSNDSYGRNILGTPPQGRADFAFFNIFSPVSIKIMADVQSFFHTALLSETKNISCVKRS